MRSDADIVVVSGLPRSGTSLMMQMLATGGLPLLVDNVRQADIDNPEGYYEYESVKTLDKGEVAWLTEAQGKGVKIISALLEFLPAGYRYDVILMHRNLDEILTSQRKMLVRRGESETAADEAKLRALYQRHLGQVERWLRAQPNMRTLQVDYKGLVEQPTQWANRLREFLGDWYNADVAARVVSPTLYRNRAATE